MIKMFASDLDGTLLNYHHLTDRTILSCLREVLDTGAHVVLATGRPTRSAASHGFGDLPIETVSSNGSIIRDASGALLKAFQIDKAALEDLLCSFPQVVFECIEPGGSSITGTLDDWLDSFGGAGGVDPAMRRRRKRLVTEGGQTVAFSQTVEQILERDICKVNCRVPQAADDAALKAYLADHADALVNEPFAPVMFEISQKGVNKAEGLAWLANYLGISEDEVAVYGDGGNDIAMLRRFRHAYATANADVEARHAAGTVLGPNALHAVPLHMARTARAQRDTAA